MRAAVMRDWTLRVDEVDDPVPGPGQALAKVLACGICGSDLHLLQHGAEQMALAEELRAEQPPDALAPVPLDPNNDVVMGHEYCCEVVELGPGCDNLKVGDVVVSMPIAFDPQGLHGVGFSNRYPGGYGELLVVNDLLGVKVPSGLSPEVASLTEPLAVGVHAVAKSRITGAEAAIVLGLGPVGLAVIAELDRRGVGPIVAADFSSTRRALAERLGATEVVDPRQTSPIEAWRRVDGTRPLVIFEAVGVPGMLDRAMRMAPKDARILVVGVCMQQDAIQPMVGIGRELNIQFALGYQPDEFSAALTALADGRVEFPAIVTSTVGIDGVPGAFAELADPEAQAKILVTA
jgi:threonine dehydrogenase-like Zn-dependent dehydrogenase